MKNYFSSALLFLLITAISACSTNGSKRSYMRDWSCDVNLRSDIDIQFSENEIQAHLLIPRKQRENISRVQVTIALPFFVTDIVSIKRIVKGNDKRIRLMEGRKKVKICGDYFDRDSEVKRNSLVIFDDIKYINDRRDVTWEIMFIDNARNIRSTSRNFNISVQS